MHLLDKSAVDSEHIGSRIRQAREQRRMTQKQFASRIAANQGTVSEIENGKRNISAVDLHRFAEILQVPILFFYEGDIPRYDWEHMLLTEFQRLPSDEAKETVIKLVRMISKTLTPN